MHRRVFKTFVSVLLMLCCSAEVLFADFGRADSPTFYLNLLTQRGAPSFDSSDSSAFSLNLLGIRRAWADSDVFPYMWAKATSPPNPDVLLLRPAGSLKLVDPSITYIYPNKPTIILTHGWNPNYPGIKTEPGTTPEWISQMGNHMLDKPWGTNYNILWWDWIEKATAYSPAGPAKEACRQGNALAEVLLTILGTDYNQPVHFIGHSLGTAVNRYAVDVVHLNGWNPANTHVTISDAAEIGDLALLVKPIPNQSAWIDSYITAFGDLHSEAVNVILRQGMPILPDICQLAEFHGYANEWYDITVQDTNSSIMGHRWSFENGGLSGAPSPGTCYAQTANPFDDQMNLESITWTDAQVVMAGRTMLLVSQGLTLWYQSIVAPIKLLGDVVIDTTTQVVTAKLNEHLGSGGQQLVQLAGTDFIQDANKSSSSYIWIPIQIPRGADLLTFEYRFAGTSSADYITASIADKQIFAIEANYVGNSTQFTNTSYIGVSGFSGQSVELLIAFNADNVSGGSVEVKNFQFHSTTVKTDLNIDGLIDFVDFSLLANQWGTTDCNDLNNWCNKCDFDKNGFVDANDLGTFTLDWLRDAGDPNTW